MVTSERPEKTLWKIFNLLAAKEERKERLVSCGPNLGAGVVHQQVQRCWDGHGSAQRGICSHSQSSNRSCALGHISGQV